MFHASAHRSANWLALLATAFFVGWPSLVHGNCCCETQQRVKLTVPVDVAPSCCQTKTSCDSRTNSEPLRSCCSGLNDDAAGCTADSNDAGCGVSCCRTVASIALRSAPPNQVRAASLLIVECADRVSRRGRDSVFESPATSRSFSPSAGSLCADLSLAEVTHSCYRSVTFQI